MNAAEFTARVVAFSKTSARDSLYPGDDYAALARSLAEDRGAEPGSAWADAADEPWAVGYSLAGPSILRTAATHSGQVVFLRGFPAAAELARVAASCGADPRLLQQHLAVVGGRCLYAAPGLPSAGRCMVQLPLTTVCCDDTEPDGAAGWLEGVRERAAAALRKYHCELWTRGARGDSIVRSYAVLSARFAVVGQQMTVGVTGDGSAWRAVVWTDAARDLSRGVGGPWSPASRSRARGSRSRAWGWHCLPVLQHRAQMALRELGAASTAGAQGIKPHGIETHGIEPHGLAWEASQNASHLPFQYGPLLDAGVARRDALYALQDVFRLSAASELHFVNLAGELAEREMGAGKQSQAALRNLRHLRAVVDAHAARVADVAALLARRSALDWPRAEGEALAEQAAAELLVDFEALAARLEKLSAACRDGMQAMVNYAAFEESTKAVANAERMERLTRLATLFIPLTFTCSLFGMNFRVFGQGELDIWISFPVAAGMVAACLACWYVRIPGWMRW